MLNVSNLTLKKEAYQRNGFIVLSDCFDPLYVNKLVEESHRVLKFAQTQKHADPIKYNQVNSQIYRIDPVVDLSDIFYGLIQDKEFISLIEFFEDSEILLLKDKLIYKPAKSRGYPMHQDYAWGQEKFPISLFSVIVSLCKADKKNGAVKFFKGYHDKLLSTKNEIRHMNEDEIKLIDPVRGELAKLNPGDIVIFKGLTPHQSGVNQTNESRPQLFFSFNHKKDGNFYSEYWKTYKEYSLSTIDKNGNYINPYESK